MLNEIFKALLITSLAGSCLAAVITIVKPITKKIFGYSWHYYIWLAVLAVMLLPVRFNLPQTAQIPPVTVQTAHTAETAQTAQTAQITDNTEPAALPTAKTSVFSSLVREIFNNRMNILAYLWLAGAFFLLLTHLIGYIRLIMKMRKNSVVVSCPELTNFTDKRVTVRVWENTSSPFMTGLFKPTLVLPARELTEEQLNNILRHEMTHFKRHDILYKWFVSLVKCVHWFNPVIWYAAKQINTECEISCDMAVTLEMSKAQEMSYIDTVLSLLPTGKTKQIPLTTQMASSKRVLKRRFEMIRNKRRTSKFVSALSAVIAVVMLGTTVFASGVLNGSIGGNENIKYEVYNGDKKISLNSQPFIYDGQYYLPLRDMLNGFGITDITYNNGIVDVSFPYHPNERYATRGRFVIGRNMVYLENGYQALSVGLVILGTPILQNGITYIPFSSIEQLIRYGQLTDITLNVIRPTEPEKYYEKGEEVFIGTALEQDNYTPENGKIVKRIIVDENGETLAVIPVENQIKENAKAVITRLETGATWGDSGYYDYFYEGASGYKDINNRLNFDTTLYMIGLREDATENPTAYIMPANVIKYPSNKYDDEYHRIIINTYKSEQVNNLKVGKIIVDENNTVVFKGENLKNPEYEKQKTPFGTAELFFRDFHRQDFENMKTYCTENCVNYFFEKTLDGYQVFGMKNTAIKSMSYANGSSETSDRVFLDISLYRTEFEETSIFAQNRSPFSFCLILQKQPDGRYLIDEFATGL